MGATRQLGWSRQGSRQVLLPMAAGYGVSGGSAGAKTSSREGESNGGESSTAAAEEPNAVQGNDMQELDRVGPAVGCAKGGITSAAEDDSNGIK